MPAQVLRAPAEPNLNVNDMRRIAQGARAAQQGDLTFQEFLRVFPRTVVADSTLGAESFVDADATAGQIDLQLQAAAEFIGVVYVITKGDATAHHVNIKPEGTELINGSNTPLSLTTGWSTFRLYSNGTQWLTW